MTETENIRKQFINKDRPTLKDVYDVYKKWLKFKSSDRIDVILATALSRKMRGTKLWLIIIAPSGDAKTEQILAINNDGSSKIVRRFTPKTLVSGSKNTEYDLAPKLKDKILLIPDFSQMLNLHPNDKALVWAQLRDLFDGYAGTQSGMGTDKEYKDLNITLIAGSTPAIDDQILIHQDLGTRELLWRINKKDLMEIEDIKDKVWSNEEHEEIMRSELNYITNAFLETHEVEHKEIPKEIKTKLMLLVDYLCVLRASAHIDGYTGELISEVYPEMPTRILKQLKRYYLCLKSLDPEYSDDKALNIIVHLVESSIIPRRKNILECVIKNNDSITTSGVSNDLKIGKKSAFTELNVLWNLGLIEKYEEINEYDRVIKQNWSPIKNNVIVSFIAKKLGIKENDKQASLKDN